MKAFCCGKFAYSSMFLDTICGPFLIVIDSYTTKQMERMKSVGGIKGRGGGGEGREMKQKEKKI